ncbi:enolase-like domain-containing protein [Blattabacterium cuenoti]|uniref:O-succinylbenzoate synthase n=1 Tax=Blattabacterium cuenoti TaxID=1653831 RepID=UPI00163C5214|nr:O-succinylbenzoate synthase [Blattabacterium cuenoti]
MNQYLFKYDKIFFKKKKFFFKKKIKNSKKNFINNKIWFLIIKKENKIGIGECNPILEKISNNKYEKELQYLSKKINILKKIEIFYYFPYISYSSILFGLEQAFLSLIHKFPIFFYSKFTEGKVGIPINRIFWLKSYENLQQEINKIYNNNLKNYLMIKLKINQKFFHYQYFFLKKIKKKYPYLKIRIDANGSFNSKEKAFYYINKLYELNIIDVIEQPIKEGNWKNISNICKYSKLPIALDEELIGINKLKYKKKLLDFINPHYIVLKPNICGSFYGIKEWIIEAEKRNIKWWITSSLESNIGINAISQWIFNYFKNKSSYNIGIHGLNINYYYNDFITTLEVKEGKIWYNPLKKWNFKKIFNLKN